MYRKWGNQKIPVLIFRFSKKTKIFSRNSLDFRLKDLHLLNKTTASFKGNNSKSGEELPHLFPHPQPDKKRLYPSPEKPEADTALLHRKKTSIFYFSSRVMIDLAGRVIFKPSLVSLAPLNSTGTTTSGCSNEL